MEKSFIIAPGTKEYEAFQKENIKERENFIVNGFKNLFRMVKELRKSDKANNDV